jgi:hypothetical protein
MVFEAFTMVFAFTTMVNVSDALGWETKTKVKKPATIFRLTGTIVFFANTMVSVIGTMVFVTIAMVPTSETTVMVEKKMVLVALTMAYKVLTIGFVIIEQSFANPKLVVFGAPARSHHYYSGKLTNRPN